MESVKVEITPGGKASRVEVIIRIVYGFIACIILSIFMVIAEILVFINFFTCLILAKRVAPEFIASVIKQMARVYTYLFFVTDERPPLTP
ncbi:MAG: DUF4389 domain-containing protein [Candidatus Diapherotrites archaeon]|nr:DUF4389 domain-containing protein [Candidatus Diapherotrites archaeon]